MTNRTLTLIAGGPKTGKTSAADLMGPTEAVRHADELHPRLNWHEQSAHVASLIAGKAQGVIEGTVVPRALRKAMDRDPNMRLDHVTVRYHSTPVAERNAGQVAMGKAVQTVWNQIKPELLRRGAQIEEK